MINKQKGNLLATAIIIIVAVSAFGVAVLKLLMTESQSTNLFLQGHQSIYLAESGMEHGLLEIKNNIDTADPATYCDDAYKTTQSLGAGEFRFKCAVYTASTQTSASISSSVMIIPVDSVTNFASMGRIVIDSEQIDYSATSTDTSVCGTAPCFVVKTRGANGTSAANHGNNDDVTQTNQILVTADGAVPSITNASASKEIQMAIRVDSSPTGWAVGDKGVIYKRLGAGAWSEVTPSPTTGSDFNDVACGDENNCWAVGAGTTIYRWNGSTWSEYTPTSPLTGALLAVTCTSANDCWVSNNARDMFHWDGTSWSVSTLTLPNDMRSIACTSTTMCVAVGNGGATAVWNGSTWTSVSSGITQQINSVACPSSSLCFAVSNNGNIIRYNGSTWSTETDPVGKTNLVSVTCPTTTFCWAITANRTNAATYNGTSWSSATIGGAAKNGLADITCPSTTECIVVATRVSTSDPDIRSWNGSTWIDDDVTITSTAQNLNAVIRVTPVTASVTITNMIWREVFN